MNEKTRPDALVAKNKSDFDALTTAITGALKRIEADQKLKPTYAVLAKLAGCSRGTLANRDWPRTQLESIKTARRLGKLAKNFAEPDAGVEKTYGENTVDWLKHKLQLSRTENAKLHESIEELSKELKQSKELLKEMTKHANHNSSQSQLKSSTGTIVRLRESPMPKQSHGPDDNQ